MSCSTNSRVITQKQRRTCGSSNCSCTRQSTFSTEGPICCNNEQVENQWIKYIPTIFGSITNPTKSSTVTLDEAWYLVNGKTMTVRYVYSQLDNANASSGSVIYSIELPSGYQYFNSPAVVGSAYLLVDTTIYTGVVIVAQNKLQITAGNETLTPINWSSVHPANLGSTSTIAASCCAIIQLL